MLATGQRRVYMNCSRIGHLQQELLRDRNLPAPHFYYYQSKRLSWTMSENELSSIKEYLHWSDPHGLSPFDELEKLSGFFLSFWEQRFHTIT